ncbi:hypothetical protein DFA_00310 [Cavenderia fasciculata]|uniref:Transmembrane protein n=1 Tax=Cavenderia fasciculata TaxID=261658 RepID=F4PY72_CACFS|nr:uncharacterized protein DFA_00310 [Cavenderia fasciculata]EGG19732.1 hypothetical protein DFA_00310 [Cavenderia fasciculata]|eukprot:XP_004358026.1 hypothetical protein DFA_00310 [Cavenderia fasciculata]
MAGRMNFRPANAAVFLIFGVAWILLIVSFGTYWYRIDVNDLTTYVYYNKIKTVGYHGTGVSDLEETDYNQRFVQIFKASLAFSVLAWVTLSLTLMFIILSLVGILAKIPLPLSKVTKIILPAIALVFCLLSMFIFVGLGDARYRDCVDINGRESCVREEFKFMYDNDNGSVGGPYTGWAAVVVSTAFVLIGGALSFLLANYDPVS